MLLEPFTKLSGISPIHADHGVVVCLRKPRLFPGVSDLLPAVAGHRKHSLGGIVPGVEYELTELAYSGLSTAGPKVRSNRQKDHVQRIGPALACHGSFCAPQDDL